MSRTVKIFTMSCANYIITAFFNALASVLGIYLLSDIEISTGMLGILFSMGGILTAAVGTLPGHLIDRIGAKKGLIMTCIAQLAAFGLFPFTHTAAVLMILMSVNSLATALSVPCNTQVLSVMGVKDPAKLLCINMVGFSLAGIVAAPVAPMLIEKAGMTWRGAYMVFFLASTVIGAVAMIFVASVKYEPSEYRAVKSQEAANVSQEDKKYRFTQVEKKAAVATALLYIGYMTVNVTLSVWQPTLMALKGFTSVEAAIPTTIAGFVSLASFFLLPTIAVKLFRTSKSTPIAFVLNIACIIGSMSSNLVVVCIARALLTLNLSFLLMHIQSDIALTAPAKAAGRYSTIAQSLANAAAVCAVILIGYLPFDAQLVLLLLCGCVGIVGSVLFFKPAREIAEVKTQEQTATETH